MFCPIKNNEKIVPGVKNLLILLNGSITIEKEQEIRAIPAKSYFFFETSFEIIAASPFIEGFVCSLSRTNLNTFPDIEKGLSKIDADFSVFPIHKAADKRSKIQSILASGSNAHLLASYTHILWSEIIQDYQNAREEKSTTAQFSELIDQNIEQNYCAGTYAEMMGIPLKKLIKEVKKAENKTPCNFITEKVIEKAKYKLLHTEDTSQMIAYQLGFEDPYYFIKYFKKNTSLTPTQFRTHHSTVS